MACLGIAARLGQEPMADPVLCPPRPALKEGLARRIFGPRSEPGGQRGSDTVRDNNIRAEFAAWGWGGRNNTTKDHGSEIRRHVRKLRPRSPSLTFLR